MIRRSLLLIIAFLAVTLASAQKSLEEVSKKLAMMNADFTVEYASNLSELDSWSDNTKFQWKAVDHSVIDNADEMQRLVELVSNPAPKDTVGFYKQFFDARDNQYIVLRVDGGEGQRLFHVRVTYITRTDDPKLNTSKTFSTRDYIYVSPPRGDRQIEIKVWPNEVGEELAKTFTFRGHSYGARGARSVMLDRSRLVPGRYDLQYVKMDDETSKTDTVTISDLQPDKLYTFYTYLMNPIVEAWLRFDGFKRMRIKVSDWAEDLVTHFDDQSAIVMTGGQMPFLKHKWLESPNPSYLDTRMFAPHDTLWLHVFKDNIPLTNAKDLVMNISLLNQDGTIKDNDRVPWEQKDDGQFFAITNGEPCVIESYLKGYAPRVTHCRGAFNPTTGWLYEESQDLDIYLDSNRMPESGMYVSRMNLTALEPVDAMRDSLYLANILVINVLNEPLTATVPYDEFASREGQQKYVDGQLIERLAKLNVTFSTSKTAMPGDRVYLKKDKSAEQNDIKIESVEGEARRVNYPSFDYYYWDAEFPLEGYLDAGNSGRPYLAVDDKEARKLPILYNCYIDIDEWNKRTEDDSKKKLNPDEEASSNAESILGAESINVSFKIPLAPPPLYIRAGVDIDLWRNKKISVFGAIGVGVDLDFVDGKDATSKWKEGYEGLDNGQIANLNPDKINIRSTDDDGIYIESKWEDIYNKFTNKEEDPYSLKASAWVELFSQYSFPILMKLEDFPGLRFFDELNINARAVAEANAKLNVLSYADKVAKKFGIKKGLEFLTENQYAKKAIKALDSGLEIYVQLLMTAKAGIYYYDDGTNEINPLKTHLVGASVMGRADGFARAGTRFNVIAGGVEAGLLACAGAYFKAGVGDRLWFDRPFKGSAWAYRLGFGLYYKVALLCWNKSDEWMVGSSSYVPPILLGNESNSNPYHKNYKSYMATGVETNAPQLANSASRRVNSSLPGTNLATDVELTYPVRFLSGGDSIIYNKTNDGTPNGRYLRVISTENPAVISDYRTGGAADYHSASSANMDIVVYEQATRKLTDEELNPSDEQLVDFAIEKGNISQIYYTYKKAGGKWYSAKPIWQDNNDTNTKPRVALDDNGHAAAIWQQGYYIRKSGLSPEEQNDIENLQFMGDLMYSRFDGTSWTEPVSILRLNRKLQLSEYQISYHNGEAFIAATEILPDDVVKPVFIHVAENGNVTITDAPMQANNIFEVRRVGDHNVVAQLTEAGTEDKQVRIALNSYDMQGQPDGQLNTSVTTGNDGISSFRLVADQNARSLSNLGLMWVQTTQDASADSTYNTLFAARLVPNDQAIIVGSPLTLARINHANQVYSYDGYMTDEKISACYLANDTINGTQLNRVVAYFSNAFSYSIQFDQDENQAITGSTGEEAQTTFLVKVTNLGQSTINRCVLSVEDVQDSIPLHLVIPAGMTAQERVSIPYQSGKAINTKLTVSYDDVLGLQAKQLPRFLARRTKRAHARLMGMTYSDDNSSEDVIYEQQAKDLFPDIPKLECYVISQSVDDKGNNRILLRVRNVSKRPMPDGYCIEVNIEKDSKSNYLENSASDILVFAGGLKSQAATLTQGNISKVGFFQKSRNFETVDIAVTIPKVTETQTLFIRPVVKKISRNLQRSSIAGGNRHRDYALVTVYPSDKTTAVDNVFDDGDARATLHVTTSGSTVTVSGAEPGQDVCLYLASGMILARQKASATGVATFNVSHVRRGVLLVSNDKETVKFIY